MTPHSQRHYSTRIGWLRAAVLGANDGIVSTSSLVMGVAAAGVSRTEVLIAAIAAMFAGAMSMAAGEYVSVSAQYDTEKADLHREQKELEADPIHEHNELAQIYVSRGLDASLANEVAEQLMNHDALGAHARDELGISTINTARPLQAALTSAVTFATGASLPLMALFIAPRGQIAVFVVSASLMSLGLLGLIAARVGGAHTMTSVSRLLFWGALAMTVTAAVGKLFGLAA